jgi:ribosomal protein L16/L10AE
MAKAKTVDEYLAGLSEDRRAVIEAMRQVVLRHLPKGYEETMSGGMIAWVVPLARLPKTYNGQPLWYAALASEKSYCSLHLVRAYGDPKQTAMLEQAFKRAGKKLDMGKACVHFTRLEDLELDAIGAVLSSTPVDAYVAMYQKSRKTS